MIITAKLNNFLKINIFFIQLRFTLKNKLSNIISSHLKVKISSKFSKSRDITLVKGPFAHKKSKEQFSYEYRTTSMNIFVPKSTAPFFFSTKVFDTFFFQLGVSNSAIDIIDIKLKY